MAVTAAALAPELMPMTSGLARGFRSIRWKSAPDKPEGHSDHGAQDGPGQLGFENDEACAGDSLPPVSCAVTIRTKSGTVTV